jgi:hypothetical protein
MGEIADWGSEGMDWGNPQAHQLAYNTALSRALYERKYHASHMVASSATSKEEFSHLFGYDSKKMNLYPNSDNIFKTSTVYDALLNYYYNNYYGAVSKRADTDYKKDTRDVLYNAGSLTTHPDYVPWPWEFNGYDYVTVNPAYRYNMANSNLLVPAGFMQKAMREELGYTKFMTTNVRNNHYSPNHLEESTVRNDMFKEAKDVLQTYRYLWHIPSNYQLQIWTRDAYITTPDYAEQAKDLCEASPWVETTNLGYYTGIGNAHSFYFQPSPGGTYGWAVSSAFQTKVRLVTRGWTPTEVIGTPLGPVTQAYWYTDTKFLTEPTFNLTPHRVELWGGWEKSWFEDLGVSGWNGFTAWDPFTLGADTYDWSSNGEIPPVYFNPPAYGNMGDGVHGGPMWHKLDSAEVTDPTQTYYGIELGPGSWGPLNTQCQMRLRQCPRMFNFNDVLKFQSRP